MPTHGKDTVVSIDTAVTGNALTDISDSCDTCEFSIDQEVQDITTFGANSRGFIPGLRNATISVGGPQDDTIDTVFLGGAEPTDGRDFVYGPEGGTSGDRKYDCKAIMTGFNPSSGVGDAARWSGELQVTGDVTLGTYS